MGSWLRAGLDADGEVVVDVGGDAEPVPEQQLVVGLVAVVVVDGAALQGTDRRQDLGGMLWMTERTGPASQIAQCACHMVHAHKLIRHMTELKHSLRLTVVRARAIETVRLCV